MNLGCVFTTNMRSLQVFCITYGIKVIDYALTNHVKMGILIFTPKYHDPC